MLRDSHIQILSLRKQGYSCKEIAPLFGVSSEWIRKTLCNLGVQTRYRVDLDHHEAIETLYRDLGWSLGQIAERYRVSKGTIRSILVLQGQEIRSRGRILSASRRSCAVKDS